MVQPQDNLLDRQGGQVVAVLAILSHLMRRLQMERLDKETPVALTTMVLTIMPVVVAAKAKLAVQELYLRKVAVVMDLVLEA